MADIVLRDRNGNQVEYPGVESIKLNTVGGGTTEFIDPDTVPQAVEKTIDPDFSAGDMEVIPEEGQVFSKVGISKPDNLIPGNIAEGVDIAGIVGTLASGGDANLTLYEEPWLDDICFWDYDGTLIANIPLDSVSELNELPQLPEHTGLTFLGWNYSLEQVQSTEYPLDVGAMYIPSDGHTHIKINVSNSSYLSVPFNFSQTVDGGVVIDWGDGSAPQTISGTGAKNVTHTYPNVGIYEIVFSVADGCTLTLGVSYSSKLINGTTYQDYLEEIYIGNNTEIGSYSGAYAFNNLAIITLPNTLTTLPERAIYSPVMKCIVIPNSITSLPPFSAVFSDVYGVGCVLSIPESVDTVTNSSISSFNGFRLCIPKKITVIPDFGSPKYAKRFFMSDSVTEISAKTVQYVYSLEKFSFPNNLVTLGSGFLDSCHRLNDIKIPPNVTTLPNNFLNNAWSIRQLYIPENITSLGPNFIYNAYSLKRLVIAGTPTITSSTSNGHSSLREVLYYSETVPPVLITAPDLEVAYFVPDNAYDAYLAKFGTKYARNLHRLSEYPGTLPTYDY